LYADTAASDAVLFTDEAELAACLVRDWLQGRVADRWWWRSVVGDLSPTQWLRQNVLARGDVLVPAMALLAERSLAPAWLARLEDSEAEEAMAMIARSYAVSQAVLQDTPAGPQPRTHDNRQELFGIEIEPQGESRSAALERLIATVPEVRAPALRPSQRRLLALVLALTRAPSWARSARFALALQALDQASPEEISSVQDAPAMQDLVQHDGDRHDISHEAVRASELSHPVAEAHATAAPLVAPDQSNAPPAGDRSPADAAASAGAELVGAIPQARMDDEDSASSSSAAPAIVAPGEIPPVAPITVADMAPVACDTQTKVPSASLVPIRTPMPVPKIDAAPRVATRFGGIFYLLNAALALELYGDFTAPQAKNLELSPWDWLALVGRAWFGAELVGDPVWKVLAELAGRAPDDEPERDFHPSSEHWLQEHIQLLHRRLALALGAEERVDVPAVVCRYNAGIEATASAVHVHLALGDLSLSIRIAGLDRDPGWIPAAGRSVAFHFL
jgi:hypothetical protein